MTTLRAKYIRDLAIRGRATRTQQSYTSYVADLARHYRRSPDRISYEEVADWLHHLIKERHQAASSVNIAVNAVRFLYSVTLAPLWDFGQQPSPTRHRQSARHLPTPQSYVLAGHPP